MQYKGKEPCQGCKKSGTDKPRAEKDALCGSCKEALLLGLKTKKESEIEYISVFQHYHVYYDNELNELAHELLSSLHNPYTQGGGVHHLHYTMGSNGKYYNIDKRFFEPLKKLFGWMNEKTRALQKELESIPELTTKQIAQERNKIYNEGVTMGRNLLVQLNSGKITLDDLNKELHYEGGKKK